MITINQLMRLKYFFPILLFITSSCSVSGMKKIAFISDRDGFDNIYLINSDGSTVQRISNNSSPDDSPIWSPNGEYLAYLNIKGIYIYNTITKATSHFEGKYFSISWSTDNKTIVFAKPNKQNNFELYTINIRTGEIEELPTLSYRQNGCPIWSPNGKYIAFSSSTSHMAVLQPGELWIVAPDGMYKRQISENESSSWADCPFYAWAPDGEQLITSRMNIIDILTNREIPLLNNRNDYCVNTPPKWSPNGKYLLFTSDLCRNGSRYIEIYRIQSDSTQLTKLTNNGGYHPAWSIDGDWIAFVSERDNNQEIYVMKSDGEQQRNLTNNLANDFSPVWQP